jgi:hypothetical protein
MVGWEVTGDIEGVLLGVADGLPEGRVVGL